MLTGVEAPTGAMQEFRGSPSQPHKKRLPGLVLLYADSFRELPAAFLLSEQRHDYLLQGHTHVKQDLRVGKMRIINSGALHRANPRTVALLDTATDSLEFLEIT